MRAWLTVQGVEDRVASRREDAKGMAARRKVIRLRSNTQRQKRPEGRCRDRLHGPQMRDHGLGAAR
jgi:hypothetical protein